MDVAYNQHSPYSRHHSHSHTNLNRLTLTPLTSRLPISDSDSLPEPNQTHHISYLEGRSAPTTPSILSRTSSRVTLRRPRDLNLPKSKSSTHLLAKPRSAQKHPHAPRKDDLSFSTITPKDRSDSDWLLRAGASISSSTRESKGQTWLVSRASSTSLSAQPDEEEEQLERDLAKEREQASRRASRRGSAVGSIDADDEFSPITTRRSFSFGPATGDLPPSRFGSRSRGNSRRGSVAQKFAPLTESEGPDGYFDQVGAGLSRGEYVTEPDFVDVENEDGRDGYGEDREGDEAVVRKLARASSLGLGGWVEKMLGWSLFAVDEDGEDEGEEGDMYDEKGEESELSSRPSRTALEVEGMEQEDVPPPLKDEEAGGWQDAAWLLSVATKVLL